MLERLISYLYIIPVALIAIILHELSHGLMSYAFGDPTPKLQGRLSLNPLRHLDPIGILMLIIFHIGWAKPVMIDTTYYKKPRLMTALVALAGPLCNFLLAFISSLFYVLLFIYGSNNAFVTILLTFLTYMIIINIGLGLFNLIPIPPLDGSKILASFLPYNARMAYLKYERYGMFILIGIILLLEVLTYFGFPSLFNYVINSVVNLFIQFWGNIFL